MVKNEKECGVNEITLIKSRVKMSVHFSLIQ